MSAKNLVVKPIPAKQANELVKNLHYSGKVSQSSQIHIGIFWEDKLEGAIQFGSSIDPRRMSNLVKGSGIKDFVEINRMALSGRLPRNSESRALSVALRQLRRHAPQIKWVVTFADGTQCGDGTIYRASGFDLVQIKKNSSLLKTPDGHIFSDRSLNDTKTRTGASGSSVAKQKGAVPLNGFQLKYIKFQDPEWADRLAVPIIPYSQIRSRGASMYRGEKVLALEA